ncbi:MAG: lamin tail domain-containing protein [Balneola sp.]
MKYFALLLTFLVPSLVFAQSANFQDDFTDQDISDWTGDNGDFIFVTENDNILLQQNASAAGTSQLSIPSTNAVGYWDFFVRLDFGPSSGNKTDIYLMSDTQDLDQALNGYMLQAGETGSGDVFRLFRITAGAKDGEVLTGTTDISGGGDYRVRVSRDASGNWALAVASSYSGSTVQEATGTDNTYTSTSYFGFKNTYTSTRTDLFFFDFKIEVPPIEITNATIQSATSINIDFSKDYDPATLQNSDFTVSTGSINPTSINQPSSSSVELVFASDLPVGSFNLDITAIEDSDNETTIADTTVSLFRFDEYQTGDIIINEFLKDPAGSLEEYIELKNTSSRLLNLKDWQIGDNGSLSTISNQDFAIQPDSFLVISTDTTAIKNVFGNIALAQVSLPSFNNTTDQVRLYDENGTTVDSLEYTPEWGGDNVAIERRDPSTPSTFIENWGDSPNALGGTAGKENEVATDTTPPDISNLTVTNATTITITYNESVKVTNAENLANYSITPSNPALSTASANGDTVILTFANALQAATIYSIDVSNQEDIFSNSASTLSRTFEYIDYTPATINDVIINEFLKDPANGLPEYVELRNTSSKYINLKDWQLGDNSSLSVLTTQNFVLRPDSFVVISPDTAALKNTFNDVYALQVSSLPSFNNTTDQVRLFDNNSTIFDSLEYTPEWGGSGVALERRSSTVSSTIQANWGDSPNALGGTPGMQNEVAPDTQPPQIENFSVTNNVSVLISYDEPLDSVQAKNIANYSITPSIAVTSVDFNDTEVTLSLGSSLQTEVNYEITISNQEDIFGNILDPQSINVQFINYTTAVINDVIINEFLKDPDNDLPEYVELRNTSSKFINLKGWKIGDNSSINTLTTQDFALRPDSFVVITSDTTTLKNTFGDVYALQSSLPSFNNSTDQVRLFDNNSSIFDSLEYEPDWGGDDVSLERRDPTITSAFRENWVDSPASLTGTPGTANQVLQDTQAPIFQNSFAVNNARITLVYDERVDETTAENFSNYSFSPSLTLSSITTDRNEVNLNFSTNLQNETTYSITIDNQEDIFGNTLAQTSTSVRYLEFSTSQPLDIVISEFLYQKESENSPEFIELYNRSNKNLDISNWTISDAANNTTTLPLGTSLETDSYIVLTDKQDFASSISNGLYLSGFPSLNDSGDGIILKSEAGVTIDSLFYTEKFGGNQDGVSAERKDPSASSNDSNNWNNSSAEGGNSAGDQNSIFQLDTVSPELIFANMLSDGSVYVAFSEFIDPSGLTVSIDGDNRNILSFDDKNANEMIVDGNGLQASSAVELTVANLNDVVGNTLSSGSIQVSQPITQGSVVINEILYDPLADSEDNLPDQTEYIELYNTQDYAISLEEIFLNDAPDEDNEVNRLTPISSQFKWIPPKGYFLIFSEDVSSSFEESQLAEYFNIESQSDQFTMQIDRSSLSLSASGDAIFISDSTGSTIDSVFYDESWQNPNRVSLNGVALEKISPTGPSNDGSNWSSSTEVSGGTPNQENSIYQEQPTAPSNTGISFTPNPFSPDDDGFEDFLTISYTLDEPDYLLRIRIYDRYGREVRELADGKSAGFSGNIIWDGLTDNGNKNRVGIYIVLFEAYNSAAGKNRTFKETVVIARKF